MVRLLAAIFYFTCSSLTLICPSKNNVTIADKDPFLKKN